MINYTVQILVYKDHYLIKMHQQVQVQETAQGVQENQQDMDKVVEILQHFAKFNEEEIGQFKEAINDVRLNRVLGCIFGSMIGDALGAYCQFRKTISEQTAQKAMQMPGGGTFVDILPGQYTDDNEMAYHLLQGLCSFNEHQQFSTQKQQILKKIGLEYVRWIGNYPFDIGNTCSAAIYILRSNEHFLKAASNGEESEKRMQQIYKDIYQENRQRQSNGSLMRITPMAAFVSLLDLNLIDVSKFVVDQIRLTHPNKQLRIAGASWVYLLTETINRKTNEPQEFAKIVEVVQKVEAFQPLNQWFKEARKPQGPSMTAAHNMGWAKIAWSYGLKFLIYLSKGQKSVKDKNLYKDWIKWVIGRAGDTDTNAAIAGGLIGAVIGFRQLPIEYLEKVFSLKYGQQMTNTSRPSEYEPSNFLRGVLLLIKKCKVYRSAQKEQNREMQI